MLVSWRRLFLLIWYLAWKKYYRLKVWVCVQAMAVVADITLWVGYDDRLWQLYEYLEDVADEAVEDQEECEMWFRIAFFS